MTAMTSELRGGKPHIKLSPMAYSKMAHYVDLCSYEISWMGFVERQENIFYIYDVALFKQKGSAAMTEIDEEGLIEMANDLLATTEGTEKLQQMRFWGHSHVNMGVFASGQDESQICQLVDQVNGYFIMGIFNKRGEARFDIVTPDIWIKHAPWSIAYEVDDTLRDAIQEEISEKVSQSYYYPTYTYNNGTYPSTPKTPVGNGNAKAADWWTEEEEAFEDATTTGDKKDDKSITPS